MQIKLDKILSSVLIVLCLSTIILSIRFIQNQKKWSPIDEYAHMDYIEKIGEGTLPKLSDPITNELFLHIINDTLRNPQRKITTYEQLGLSGISYEAIHPPLYYVVLSFPNLLMKMMNIEIFTRLKILRICSYLLFVIGICLCIPIFNSLNKLGFSIPPAYGLGCVLFGLIIITHQRYGLGNNMLSPFMINCTALFLIKYYIKPSNKYLYLFITFSLLSVFTALSSVFILPVFFLLMLYKYRSTISHKNLIHIGVMFLTTIVLFIGWKKITLPNQDVNAWVKGLLNLWIPAGFLDYKTFCTLWLNDAFTLSFIKKGFDVGIFVLVALIINFSICLIYFKTLIKNQTWLLMVGFLFATMLISAFIINKYIGGVHWAAFRHYLGFIPVIYVSCTSFILVVYSKYFKKKKLQG